MLTPTQRVTILTNLLRDVPLQRIGTTRAAVAAKILAAVGTAIDEVLTQAGADQAQTVAAHLATLQTVAAALPAPPAQPVITPALPKL